MALLGATPYVRVPGRTLADLNATLSIADNISITGYVRNLTNERYLPDNWNVANVIPGNPPVVIVSQNSLSDPRTFGAILNFKF
jgi:iron complex outermembrane receptor protein